MIKQKGFVTSLIIIILAAAALAGGYLVYQKQAKPTYLNQAPQPTVQPSPSPVDETAGWKTYTNSKYKYAIKYPQEMSLDSNDQYAETISLNKQIFISVFPHNKPLCRGDCPTETIKQTDSVRIGSLAGEKIIGIKDLSRSGGYSPPQSFVRYEILHNAFVYEIEITELGGLTYSYDDEKKYPADRVVGDIPADKLNIFNKIVLRFAFL